MKDDDDRSSIEISVQPPISQMPGYSKTPTPTPSSNIIYELTRTVSRLDGKVERGFDDISIRIKKLEDNPLHSCIHEGDISELITARAKEGEQIKSLSKWKAYMMGFVSLVAGAAMTFAISSSVADATAKAEMTSLRRDVENQGASIKVVEDGLEDTRRAVINEVRREGRQTRLVVEAEEKSVSITHDEFNKLRPYEQTVLKQLIARAKEGR